jgi:hypothetical protein
MRLTTLLTTAALLCGLSTAASATTITLSSISSDGTPVSQLDAELDFSVSGSTLTLTLENTGTDFNISGIWFNGSGAVTGLTLVSATRNGSLDVTSAWSPVETGTSADGFGSFDFALTDGVGETNPDIAHPGDTIVFVLTISGSGTYTDADFIVGNANDYVAAAKFVNGPPDPECASAIIPTEQCPEGIDTEDSAFGTTTNVPEPASALFLLVGLAGLAWGGRSRA